MPASCPHKRKNRLAPAIFLDLDAQGIWSGGFSGVYGRNSTGWGLVLWDSGADQPSFPEPIFFAYADWLAPQMPNRYYPYFLVLTQLSAFAGQRIFYPVWNLCRANRSAITAA
jgi:hypothetical protein